MCIFALLNFHKRKSWKLAAARWERRSRTKQINRLSSSDTTKIETLFTQGPVAFCHIQFCNAWINQFIQVDWKSIMLSMCLFVSHSTCTINAISNAFCIFLLLLFAFHLNIKVSLVIGWVWCWQQTNVYCKSKRESVQCTKLLKTRIFSKFSFKLKVRRSLLVLYFNIVNFFSITKAVLPSVHSLALPQLSLTNHSY